MTEELDIEQFQTILLQMRAQLLGDTGRLHNDGASQHTGMPTHMADAASDTQEREFSFERLSHSTEVLDDIDEALKRIEKGTYGECTECGAEIGERRLRIKPYANMCIECRRKEENH